MNEQEQTRLVVNAFVKILDEDIALTSLAERGVALGPHDTAIGSKTHSC